MCFAKTVLMFVYRLSSPVYSGFDRRTGKSAW